MRNSDSWAKISPRKVHPPSQTIFYAKSSFLFFVCEGIPGISWKIMVFQLILEGKKLSYKTKKSTSTRHQCGSTSKFSAPALHGATLHSVIHTNTHTYTQTSIYTDKSFFDSVRGVCLYWFHSVRAPTWCRNVLKDCPLCVSQVSELGLCRIDHCRDPQKWPKA